MYECYKLNTRILLHHSPFVLVGFCAHFLFIFYFVSLLYNILSCIFVFISFVLVADAVLQQIDECNSI